MFNVTKKINILNINYTHHIFNRSFNTNIKKNFQKCQYCKERCFWKCKTCNGIGRTFYGEKEYRCEVCKFSGIVYCELYKGS